MSESCRPAPEIRKKDFEDELPSHVERQFRARQVDGDVPEIVFGVGKYKIGPLNEGEPPMLARRVGDKLWLKPDFPEVETVMFSDGWKAFGRFRNFGLSMTAPPIVFGGKNVSGVYDDRDKSPFHLFEHFEEFRNKLATKSDIGFWYRVTHTSWGHSDFIGLHPYKVVDVQGCNTADEFLEKVAEAVVDVVAFGRGMERIQKVGPEGLKAVLNKDDLYRRLQEEIAYHTACLDEADGTAKGLRSQIEGKAKGPYADLDRVLSSGDVAEIYGLRKYSVWSDPTFGETLAKISYHERVLDGLQNRISGRDRELMLQAYQNLFDGNPL